MDILRDILYLFFFFLIYFFKFDRMEIWSIFTIQSLRGCLCRYPNVFSSRFSANDLEFDILHCKENRISITLRKDNTEQTNHTTRKHVKFVPKAIVNPIPSKLRGDGEFENITCAF